MLDKKNKIINTEDIKNKLIKEKFNEIKNKETHRKVKLKYRSCCGCGCDITELERLVPFDSPLHNGDMVKQILKTDKIIAEYED